MRVLSTAPEVFREDEKRSQVLLFEYTLRGFCMRAAGRDKYPDRQGASLAAADWELAQCEQDEWPGGLAERCVWVPGEREGKMVRHLPVGNALGQRRDS
jgi:hypothetical protein